MSRAPTAVPCCQPFTGSSLDDETAAELARAFAALADPNRLKVLNLIASAGEICSCELTGPLGKSQPTVSHHTSVLADAGLIVGEKRGRWVYWRLVPDAMARLHDATSTRPQAEAAKGQHVSARSR